MFKNIVVAIFFLAIFPGVVFSAGSCEGFQSGAIGGDWPNGRSAKLVINTIDDSNCTSDVEYFWGPYKKYPPGSYITEATIDENVMTIPLASGNLRARLVVTANSDTFTVKWQKMKNGKLVGKILTTRFRQSGQD
jgi:hypothetical protein